MFVYYISTVVIFHFGFEGKIFILAQGIYLVVSGLINISAPFLLKSMHNISKSGYSDLYLFHFFFTIKIFLIDKLSHIKNHLGNLQIRLSVSY